MGVYYLYSREIVQGRARNLDYSGMWCSGHLEPTVDRVSSNFAVVPHEDTQLRSTHRGNAQASMPREADHKTTTPKRRRKKQPDWRVASRELNSGKRAQPVKLGPTCEGWEPERCCRGRSAGCFEQVRGELNYVIGSAAIGMILVP